MIPVWDYSEIIKERNFYQTAGKSAKVVKFAAHAHYIVNEWETIAQGYKEGDTFYLVIKG